MWWIQAEIRTNHGVATFHRHKTKHWRWRSGQIGAATFRKEENKSKLKPTCKIISLSFPVSVIVVYNMLYVTWMETFYVLFHWCTITRLPPECTLKESSMPLLSLFFIFHRCSTSCGLSVLLWVVASSPSGETLILLMAVGEAVENYSIVKMEMSLHCIHICWKTLFVWFDTEQHVVQTILDVAAWVQ